MSDRAMIYCPTCRNLAKITSNPVLNAIELVRDPDAMRCANGHVFPDYQALMAMEPELIKLIPKETPGPNDTKVEVWVNKDIWTQFSAKYPAQVNATVESILRLYLVGEPVIIDGGQAAHLRKLGVKTGAEMVAALEVAKTLEAQLQTAEEKISLMQSLFQGAGVQAPV